MARRKRRGGRPAWKKWVRAAVGIAGTAFGILVAANPSARGVKTAITGDFETGGKQILYDYTGVDLDAKAVNIQQAVTGVGAVVGGILIIKLFRFLGRTV